MFEKRSVEKIHKPKRKETVAEMLRGGVRQLERLRHPKILTVSFFSHNHRLLPYHYLFSIVCQRQF